MGRRGVRPDVVSCGTAIVACERVGEWRTALYILNRMERPGMERPQHPRSVRGGVKGGVKGGARGWKAGGCEGGVEGDIEGGMEWRITTWAAPVEYFGRTVNTCHPRVACD